MPARTRSRRSPPEESEPCAISSMPHRAGPPPSNPSSRRCGAVSCRASTRRWTGAARSRPHDSGRGMGDELKEIDPAEGGLRKAFGDLVATPATDPELAREYTAQYVAALGVDPPRDPSAQADLATLIAGALPPRLRETYEGLITTSLTELAAGHRGSTPAPPKPSQRGGDPVVLFSGELAHESDDLRVAGAGLDF